MTPGYFSTLKMALLRGSDFDSSDARDGVRTILINKAAADQFWPGQDAIGKRVRGAGQDAEGQRLPWYVVKGVVTSVRHDGLREAPRPMLYFPLNEGPNDPPAHSATCCAARTVARRRTQFVAPSGRSRRSCRSPPCSRWTMSSSESVTRFSFTMLTLGIAAAIALVLGAKVCTACCPMP